MGRRALAGDSRRTRTVACAEHDGHDRHIRRTARRGRHAARLQAHRPLPTLPDEPGMSVEERYLPTRAPSRLPGRPEPQTNLADILERVLDKGIVIAGDIQINLLDIELLTIKLRLLIASVDRAKEMGINWWESDASLQKLEDNGGAPQLEEENRELRERIERLERRLESGGDG